MVVNPQTIKTGFNIALKSLVKAAPTISVIFGVFLMAGSTVKTGIEAPKLKKVLDELNDDDTLSHNEYLKKKLNILLYHLGLPAIMMFGGAGFIFGGYKIKCTQYALSMAALASQTDNAEKLEKKIIEKYGNKEYEKIQDDLAKDEVRTHPVNYSTVINTGRGNVLCYDPILHDYYWSDLDFIKRVADNLNSESADLWRKHSRSAISYDRWRYELELPYSNENEFSEKETLTDIQVGKHLGWYDSPIHVKITVMLLPDNTPCHIIGFARDGGPKWHLNIEDKDRVEYGGIDDTDDETDMPWR